MLKENNKDIIHTDKEKDRYEIIRACIDGDYTNAEAAQRLGMSVRQVQRIKHEVDTHDEGGAVHGLKGKVSNNKTGPKTEKIIITFLSKKKHRDFGPTFAREKLESMKNISLSEETIRLIMMRNNIWKPKKGKKMEYHQWREPMARRGELVQYDGSYHDWNEDGEEECFLAAVDDASGHVTALFEDHEGIYPTFRFWFAYFEQYGLPVAIYLDKFGTYKVNHKNAVDNKDFLSQFERAMQECRVDIIHAHSPQAKGRVERGFGTHQDRLVKELRLAGIKARDVMNKFLRDVYLPEHNARFGREPRDAKDAHRPLTDKLRRELPAIFSVQSERIVRNDFCIQWEGRWFQLLEGQPITIYRKDIVIVEERLDGTIHLRAKKKEGCYLKYLELSHRPAPTKRLTLLSREAKSHKPASNHPWRQYPKKK